MIEEASQPFRWSLSTQAADAANAARQKGVLIGTYGLDMTSASLAGMTVPSACC